MNYPLLFLMSPIDMDRMSKVEAREVKAMRARFLREWNAYWAKAMHRRGYTNVQIAKELGISESSVRNLKKV